MLDEVLLVVDKVSERTMLVTRLSSAIRKAWAVPQWKAGSCRCTRLLRDFSSRVEGLDSAKSFLEDTMSLFNQSSNVLDECFFVKLVLFLVALCTGEVLWRDDVSATIGRATRYDEPQ